MPSVQSLISLATLASRAAAQETTDQLQLTCATDEHVDVDVLQTSLEEIPTPASTASPDVTGSIFATYSKADTTMVPTLEFDLDVSGMVTKLTAKGTEGTTGDEPLGTPYNKFNVGDFTTSTSGVTSPVITWEIYQDNITQNRNWAFGSQCDVAGKEPIFESSEATQTVIDGLGTLKIANAGAISTINYELEIPEMEKATVIAAINTFIAGFETADSDLPETIVLMANSNPLFCAKLFSTTGVKNGAGHFADAAGNFVDPSNGAQ